MSMLVNHYFVNDAYCISTCLSLADIRPNLVSNASGLTYLPHRAV